VDGGRGGADGEAEASLVQGPATSDTLPRGAGRELGGAGRELGGAGRELGGAGRELGGAGTELNETALAHSAEGRCPNSSWHAVLQK
jgi:hypothetical protein